MSISPWSGTRGLERLPCLKHYNVRELEGGFTLQQNAAKNTNYIQKCFTYKQFRIKFHTKNPGGAYVYNPPSGVRWLQRLPCLK